MTDQITRDEAQLLAEAENALNITAPADRKHRAYYEGRQTLQHLGLALPPSLRTLETVVNWPRVVVDTIEERQDVRGIMVPAHPEVADDLRAMIDANDLEAELCKWKRDRLIYGRAYLSVGVGDAEGDYPIICVESPRQMTVKYDYRRKTIAHAVRIVTDKAADGTQTRYATIYTPDTTTTYATVGGAWRVVDRDEHRLGIVPVIPSFNRQMTGETTGHSEMDDIMGVTDAAARAITQMQAALETNAVPKRIIMGAKRSDFADPSAWTNYLNPFVALQNAGAKVTQLAPGELSNFHNTIELYGKLAASLTGFPARYFGLITTNPPAEGAIRAEESKLVKRVERVNAECGAALSRALTIAARIMGHTIPMGAVNVAWHDPATPTFSQKADALQKLAGGKPLISREGAWDELGWDDARKATERGYLREEETDPDLLRLLEKTTPALTDDDTDTGHGIDPARD